MNARIFLFLGWMLAASACRLLAQAPSPNEATSAGTPPPLPPGPLVLTKAADFARWTVTTTIKVPGGANPGKETKPNTNVTDVTKTGSTRHLVTTTSDGGRLDVWCEGSLQVQVRPEWRQPLLSTGESREDAARVDFSKGDFAGLGWITLQKYTGLMKVDGKDCIVYKDEAGASPRGQPGGADAPVERVAYVDLETRLPVAVVAGPVATVYRFQAAPTEKVVLPAEARSVIDAWNRRKQDMARKPSNP